MSRRASDDITWLAPRTGQDWEDQEVHAAIEWLTSFVPKQEWERRAAQALAKFEAAKAEWAQGRRVDLFDPADRMAWYVYLARCYGDPVLRPNFFEPDGYRVAPIFKRLGQLLPDLKNVVGVEERVARLMIENRATPDDGIFELLVAAAYKRRGWTTTEFVPEAKGIGKRPDLFVTRPGSSWAVECKRAGRSEYAREERHAGERMASQAHQASRAAKRPIAVLVRYNAELVALPENYLAEKVARFLTGKRPTEWDDEGGSGLIIDVRRNELLEVLRHDDIWFGSSRMLQLLLGRYDPQLDFDIAGEWEPAEGRPFHAHWVSHVSVVAWASRSAQAAHRKAKHFRSVIGKASEQLSGDRPGVIHVGYEAVGGNTEDELRHKLNREQMQAFDARKSRLYWVYGSYFQPERTTAAMESCAVSETTAFYPVGRLRVPEPLPGHMLFVDQNGRPGTHF